MRHAALAIALALAGCAAPAGGISLPGLVVALGDSITMAMNSAGEGDMPQHSWATGLSPDDGIESFVERVQAKKPDALALNDARSGARVADVVAQAQQAARQRPDLVLLLIGANDACAQPMTGPDEFRAGLVAVADALPRSAAVYALSVPDVTQLHRAMEGNETARAIWKAFGICPAVLGEAATEESRRDVRVRIVAYNAAIASVAAERGWYTDEGAVFAEAYATAQVSSIDAFHPSRSGQARLAEVAWAAGPFT